MIDSASTDVKQLRQVIEPNCYVSMIGSAALLVNLQRAAHELLSLGESVVIWSTQVAKRDGDLGKFWPEVSVAYFQGTTHVATGLDDLARLLHVTCELKVFLNGDVEAGGSKIGGNGVTAIAELQERRRGRA